MSFLRAQGRRIVDEEGAPVQLRGCNIGGWLLVEPWILRLPSGTTPESEKELWDSIGARLGEEAKLSLIRTHRETFFTEADVRRIADAGMNCVRIPIWWRAVSDPAYGGDAAYLQRAIDWCADYGIYVIIDLHGAPGGQSNKGEITGEPTGADLWKDPAFRDQTVEWWRSIASAFADDPAVAGYDLLNEAFSAPVDELVRFYDTLYETIRSVDQRHLIIMEDGLLGFHQLPQPEWMGWSNIAYSFHYYPQTREEALDAAGLILPRFQRAALSYGVPVLVGEFNTVFLDRGGTDLFRRYVDAFEYYGWPWTFWTYKKLEPNHDALWGLFGYRAEDPEVNVSTDSSEALQEVFRAMETSRTAENPLLRAALAAPSRWDSQEESAKGEGGLVLTLADAYLLRPAGGELRMEWGWNPPNAGYWKKGDSVAWRIHVPEAGTYEVLLEFANNTSSNIVELWVDGVRTVRAPLQDSGGWRRFARRSVGFIYLEAGSHSLEFAQADTEEAFVNLRGAHLKPTSQSPTDIDGSRICLKPVNALPLRPESPIRVEWLNDPPDFGNWLSGEMVSWNVRVEEGASFRAEIAYATQNTQGFFRVLIDGSEAAQATLGSTGGWQAYRNIDMGTIHLPGGEHTISAVWNTDVPYGAGNLQHLLLTRE